MVQDDGDSFDRRVFLGLLLREDLSLLYFCERFVKSVDIENE